MLSVNAMQNLMYRTPLRNLSVTYSTSPKSPMQLLVIFLSLHNEP